MVQTNVTLHGFLLARPFGRRHFLLGALNFLNDRVDTANRNNSIARKLVGITFTRILGKISDRSVTCNCAFILSGAVVFFSGQKPHRRCLASAIATN